MKMDATYLWWAQLPFETLTELIMGITFHTLQV